MLTAYFICYHYLNQNKLILCKLVGYFCRVDKFYGHATCGLGGVLSMFGGPVKLHSNTQQEC